MTLLILLNGPPASGKSTAARLWAERTPLTLCLDLDVLRAMLSGWRQATTEAGLLTRDLAARVVHAQLIEGRDVIIPQFIGAAGVPFIDRLHAIADDAGATFVEIALRIDAASASRHFEARAEAEGPQDRHGELDAPLTEVIRAHEVFLGTRADLIRIDSVDGDPAATARALGEAVESLALDG
ncbi:AAA family ATPase [Microbacterium sp. Mu-80]|uniref:AAA family ATPase n=1 Tax=Microbacterium bandirmense TaxID=3122050 RepID=A0ABU8LCN4_9MICO